MRLRWILPVLLAGALPACSSSLDEAQENASQAQVLFNAGDLPGARAAIARALSFRDDQLDILLLDARIKTAMQDYSAAYESYRTVLVFDPNNQEALSIVAQAAVMGGDDDTAHETIKRALELNPNNPEVLMSKGILEIRENKFDEAIKTADKLLESPSSSSGTVLKARALFLKGDRAASYSLLREAAEKFGNDQMVAAALLENARAEGDYEAMFEQFTYLSLQNAQSADLALDEINTRYKAGDLAGARKNGLRFLERFGDRTAGVGQLADLWREYDDEPLTAGDIQSLSQEAPAVARLAIIQFYLDREKDDFIVPLLSNISDPRIFAMMNRLQVRRGDVAGYKGAIQILQQDQSNCEALSAEAEWYLREGAYTKAVVPAQVLASECRDRPNGYRLLATAYDKAGRPAAVERAFREGIDVHPQDAGLTRAFSDWLLTRGRRQSAVSTARRLTTAAPARNSSWAIYADVCRKAGNSSCLADAQRGASVARTNFSLDPLPGVKRGDTLFGRTWR